MCHPGVQHAIAEFVKPQWPQLINGHCFLLFSVCLRLISCTSVDSAATPKGDAPSNDECAATIAMHKLGTSSTKLRNLTHCSHVRT